MVVVLISHHTCTQLCTVSLHLEFISGETTLQFHTVTSSAMSIIHQICYKLSSWPVVCLRFHQQAIRSSWFGDSVSLRRRRVARPPNKQILRTARDAERRHEDVHQHDEVQEVGGCVLPAR